MAYITECENRAEIWADDAEEVRELPEMVALAEVLWEQLANGWTLLQASDLGYLSEAPVLSRDICVDDRGEWVVAPNARLYYFPRYQIESAVNTLARDGMVAFDLVKLGD